MYNSIKRPVLPENIINIFLLTDVRPASDKIFSRDFPNLVIDAMQVPEGIARIPEEFFSLVVVDPYNRVPASAEILRRLAADQSLTARN